MKTIKKIVLISALSLFTATALTACVKEKEFEATVNPLTEQVTQLDGYVDSLETKVATLETSLATLNKTLSGLDGEVDEIVTTYTQAKTALETEIATIKEELTALKTQDGALEDEFDELTGDIDELSGKLDTLQASVTALTQTVTEIQEQAQANANKINDLEAQAQANANKINDLEGQAQVNVEQINKLINQLNCLNNGGHYISEIPVTNEDGTHLRKCKTCSYFYIASCAFTWESNGDGTITGTCECGYTKEKLDITHAEIKLLFDEHEEDELYYEMLYNEDFSTEEYESLVSEFYAKYGRLLYNGKEQTRTIYRIKFEDRILTEGIDFTVSDMLIIGEAVAFKDSFGFIPVFVVNSVGSVPLV